MVRTAAIVRPSVTGIHARDAPHVGAAEARAYAISAAAIASDVMICSFVYSIWVPQFAARSPSADIALASLSTE